MFAPIIATVVSCPSTLDIRRFPDDRASACTGMSKLMGNEQVLRGVPDIAVDRAGHGGACTTVLGVDGGARAGSLRVSRQEAW